MKMIVRLQITSALLLIAAPLAARAQTTFFSDNFSHGSTTNALSIPGGTPTASSTSYDFATSKNTTTSTIGANLLHCLLTLPTASGFWEAQALFTTNTVSLNSAGDYVDLAIVFTNTTGGLLTNGATSSSIWVGLYNSGAAPGKTNPPVPGAFAAGGLNTTSGSLYATNNCQLWSGYVGAIYNGSGPVIKTRPVQNGVGTTSANQELLGDGASGGTYNNPTSVKLVTGTAQTFTIASNSASTLDFRITLDPGGSGKLVISNAIFSGVGTGGTLLLSNVTSTSTILATAFDGLAFGYFIKTLSLNPAMDVSSITVTGQSTPVSGPPTITSEPSPVVVTTNGSCAFIVGASGQDVTYQWHRGGTNLNTGGNISVQTSQDASTSMLVISPAGPADAVSSYYVTVSGTGNYSTNSVTNSLSLIPATNLVWSGSIAWDLNTSPSWQDTNGNTGLYFNFGDPVTFDDTGAGGTVVLTGAYLSAASVTVNSAYAYIFSGSGSFAGPGSLIYNGSAQLSINNTNTYTGGTLISNATAKLRLGSLYGLGTGPVTLAQAGGQLEIVNKGSSTAGIPNDFVVADDFTFVVDPTDTSYGAVLNGNLSGTAGKTLTINHGTSSGTTTTRIRISGTNTTYNANLNLNDSLFLWACSPASGSETYNGLIFGSGAYMQKSGNTYLNNTNTFSGGAQLAGGSIGLGTNSVSSSPPTVDSGPIGTGPLYLQNDSTTSLAGSGTIFASGGPRTIANLIQYPSGSNNLTLVIGGTNNLTLSGAFTLQGNDGGGAGTNRTVQADAFATLSGVISDGGLGVGLIKTGTNVLALSNTEAYTGPTTVSAGTLLVNGSLAAASAVTVATNGTLGGTGTIGGSVTVNAGGAIAPGASVGTLNISSNLSLAGNLKIEVNKSLSPTSDMVVVSGTITNTGTGVITVTNIGATALQAGDVFNIFNGKAVTGGGSMTVTGGGSSVTWTNKLAIDGTIAVLSVLPSTPTNITYSVASGTLTLAWPPSYTGYLLQSNSVSVTASNSWFDVPNSGSSDTYPVTLDPLKTNVFYRLRHP